MKTPATLALPLFLVLAACQPAPEEAPPTIEDPAPITARVTPDGGTFDLGDDLVLVVAPGAVDEPVDVSANREPAPAELDALTQAIQLEPDGLTFQAEVMLLVPVDDSQTNARAFLSNGHGGFYQPDQIREPGAIEVELDQLTQTVIAPNQPVEEITIIAPPAEVDVLFVIDNSCSMYEEQTTLAAEADHMFDYFLGSGIDYHVGAVSTDMMDPAQTGRLRSSGGVSWVDATTPDAQALFGDLVVMGTSGSYEEQGRDAAYTALDTHRAGPNAGFWRDDAALHIVFVSDEEDQSVLLTRNDFASWMTSSKPFAGEAQAHAIVGIPGASCFATDTPGLAYLDVVDQTDGQAFDLCDTDWGAHMDDIGFEATGWERDYLLLHDADPASIAIEADFDGATTTYDPSAWDYDAATRIVTFSGDEVPPPDAVVRLTYLPL